MTTRVLIALAFGIATWYFNVQSSRAETGQLAIPIVDDKGEPRLLSFYAKSYALVIGIDAYDPIKDGWSRLKEAVNDAVAVTNELERHGFKVVVKVDRDVALANGRRVKGERIDLAALEASINDFIRDHGFEEEARIVIWYSGHGHTVARNGYLVPAGAPNPGPSSGSGDRTRAEHFFADKALNMVRFSEYMQRFRSRHVLAIFDSCFAGEGIPRSSNVIDGARVTQQSIRPVRHFITSGDALQEVADDGKFRELFIRALQGVREPDGQDADANMDGFVSGTELGRYINRKVAYYSPTLRQTPQSAKMRDRNYDLGEFVFKVLPPQPRSVKPLVANAAPAPIVSEAERVWRDIPPDASRGVLEAYVKAYPNTVFAAIARDRIDQMDQALKKAIDPPLVTPAPVSPAPPAASPPNTAEAPSPAAPVVDRSITQDAGLTSSLQTELKRVGCYSGDIDGRWGALSREAFRLFLNHAKLEPTTNPTLDHLEIARLRTPPVCPLSCGTDEILENGKCVEISKEPSTTSVRPAAKPNRQERRPTATASGSDLRPCGKGWFKQGEDCRNSNGQICTYILCAGSQCQRVCK
jgi:hypothetical protein